MSTPTFETGGRAGLTAFEAAASNGVKTIKATSGELRFLHVYNPNATVAFVQLYDVAGAITVGTTAPKLSLPVPPTGTVALPVDRIGFLNSIKYACTTTATGATAPTTALVVNASYV